LSTILFLGLGLIYDQIYQYCVCRDVMQVTVVDIFSDLTASFAVNFDL